MLNALKLLLSESIDYSGCSSSSGVTLRDALRNYVEFTKTEDAWLASRFVIPHDHLSELTSYADRKHRLKGPLSLCIAGPETSTLNEFKNVVKSIEHEIMAVHREYPGEVRTNILELKLPAAVVVQLNPEQLVKALESVVISAAESGLLPHRVFFEIPESADTIDIVKKVTKVIAVHNKSILKRKIDNYLFSGLKIQCGTNEGGYVPDADYLAEAMLFARDANVAIKFSGDSNSTFPEVDTKGNILKHGFLNVLLAGMLAYTQDLNVEETCEVIEELVPSNFVFNENYVAWKELATPAMETKMLRMLSITSFDCTELETPLLGLKKLGLLS